MNRVETKFIVPRHNRRKEKKSKRRKKRGGGGGGDEKETHKPYGSGRQKMNRQFLAAGAA